MGGDFSGVIYFRDDILYVCRNTSRQFRSRTLVPYFIELPVQTVLSYLSAI